MALTKDQLRTENQNSFPDNTDGLITPEILRDYNDDVIDSLVVSSDTGSFITDTTQLNQFTASADSRLTNIETTTASLETSVSNINTFTSSADGRLNNIETTTASLQTQIDNIDTGSLLETASVNLNTITFTKADTTTFDITVDTGSGVATDITALNEFTSSQLTINSGYNTFTESVDSRLDNIELATGSYATTGSNIFTANQIISGTLDVEQTFTASLTQGNIYVGDATGTTSEIATGSLSVSSSLDAQDLIIGVKNTSLVTLPKGTPVYATGVTGENINIESASNASSATMPAIGILNEELTPNAAGFAILSGRLIGVDTNGFTAGNNIYVNTDGTFTQTKPTGTALIQNIGVVGKVDASDGEIVVIGSGRSNDLPNITEGYAWVGDGNGVPQAVSTASWDAQADLTSLNTFTASQETKNTTLETVTSSFDSRLNNIELATGSYATTGSNTFTANQIISGTLDIEQTFTASLGEGLVFVGDANGRTITAETASFGGGGGFPFEGNAVITGSLGISGSLHGGVVALSISSNTASLDMRDGNMFTLTLASSADTNVDVNNLIPGQTINLRVTQPATSGSISFSNNVRFPNGNAFTATATGSVVDLVTFVTFDATYVEAVGIKNLS